MFLQSVGQLCYSLQHIIAHHLRILLTRYVTDMLSRTGHYSYNLKLDLKIETREYLSFPFSFMNSMYQEVQYYFLSRGSAVSKWPPTQISVTLAPNGLYTV